MGVVGVEFLVKAILGYLTGAGLGIARSNRKKVNHESIGDKEKLAIQITYF